MNFLTHIAAAFLAMLLVPSTLFAQSNWLAHTDETSVTVEWAKPSFSGEEDFSLISANYYLLGHYALMDELRVTAELPFVAYGFCLPSANEWITANTLGNPYLGIEAGTGDRTWFAELGTRLPVVGKVEAGSAKSSALAAAMFADPERYAAFVGDVVPVQLSLNASPWITPGTLQFRGRLGIWQYFPLADDSDGSSSMHWSTALVFRSMNFTFGGGYAGQYFFENDGLFSKQALHQWGFLFGMHYEAANVGFAIRLPLNAALTERVNYAFNLNATWAWK